MAHHVKGADSTVAMILLEVAVNDPDSHVRDEASDSLLRHFDHVRKPEASRMGKFLASAIQTPTQFESAKSLLRRLITSGGRDAALSQWHDLWIRTTTLLGQSGFGGVYQIIKFAIEGSAIDSLDRVKDALQMGQQDTVSAAPVSVQTALPLAFVAALEQDLCGARADVLDLLRALLCENKETARAFESLMDVARDPTLVEKLSELSIEDEDVQVRKRAFRILKSLFKTARFQDTVALSWSKAIKSCIGGQAPIRHQVNAVSVLHDLTDSGSMKQHDKLYDLVAPSLLSLLKIVLHGKDQGYEEIRKECEDILLENIAPDLNSNNLSAPGPRPENLVPNPESSVSDPRSEIVVPDLDHGEQGIESLDGGHDVRAGGTPVVRLGEEVLSAIPSMVSATTPGGKQVALQLVQKLTVSHNVAATVAHELAPLLRSASTFPRGVALDILYLLFSQYGRFKPDLIESAIPEIITLALDESDNVGHIRMSAIRLLSALCSGAPDGEGENTTAASNLGRVLFPLAKRFMTLLQHDNLRPSVVHLLSLMARNSSVRETISLQIIGLVFEKSSTVTVPLQAHGELLLRLISDERYGEQPMDIVMLFFTTVLATKQDLVKHRFRILGALQRRYGSESEKAESTQSEVNADEPAAGSQSKTAGSTGSKSKMTELTSRVANSTGSRLVEWFAFGLFGKHGTTFEVDTWLEHSQNEFGTTKDSNGGGSPNCSMSKSADGQSAWGV